MDKRTETQSEERGGQAICFSWGERNVCEEQEPPGTLRYAPHDWLAQSSQLTATLFLLYPHTAFAQTQKGTSINPTSTQTTSTDATDTPFRAGPEVPFPTLYRGTNPNRRFKKRQQGLHSAHIRGIEALPIDPVIHSHIVLKNSLATPSPKQYSENCNTS